MILASDIKIGTVLQLEGKLHKVLDVLRHASVGQTHGFIELKLRDLKFGHLSDRRVKPTDKLEAVELVKRQMNFLYSDGESFYFMDPITFEQIGVTRSAIGTIEKFLKEGTQVTIELFREEPISIQFAKTIELKVAITGLGIRDGQENTMKSATLENGIEIMVPQFIETGDVIRADTEKVKYIDRVAMKRI